MPTAGAGASNSKDRTRSRQQSMRAVQEKNEALLKRVWELESIVKRAASYPALVIRYERGEKSWANMLNELERDIAAAVPDDFHKRLTP